MGRESVILLWALLLVWSRECQSYTTAGYVYSATDSITDGEKETNISCDFDFSECGYRNASSDFQWIRHTGPTASAATGPSGDHTTGHGYYMYIETSNVLTRAVARLVSPTVSDSGQYCLQFAYHMYGADIDQLRVLVGSSVEWIRSNNQGNSWHQASVDVYIFYDQIVFEGFGGNGYRGDIAIDDVVLYPGSCQWTGW
ncbi:MDGA1 [Branchiostoma lanceolatum]|uniref:MDGA1 protein n=1 Tax=Branchiostoma lanceolatum TaxID=7740 RepID=A0A8K0EEX5_BRALA|nr:MDGA1 [Branchiostoma lanceolatum]